MNTKLAREVTQVLESADDALSFEEIAERGRLKCDDCGEIHREEELREVVDHLVDRDMIHITTNQKYER